MAGLVAITPAAGDVQPYGALILGVIASIACYGAINLKSRLGYDDSLDVFGVHGVGGFVGTVMAGFLASEGFGGNQGDLAIGRQTALQLGAALGVGLYTAVVSWVILKGVDGVVFVADSQMLRSEANIESMDNLRTNLAEQGYNLDTLPYVIQYNKRDMPAVSPVEELREMLNTGNVPDFNAVATTGEGVFETLKSVAKLVLTELKRGAAR